MNETAELSFDVPDQAAWAAGHFPGDPLMPGAKLLDMVIEALQAADALARGPVNVAQTKFIAPVRPGTTVVLSYEYNNGRIRFNCAVGEQTVATGQLASAA